MSEKKILPELRSFGIEVRTARADAGLSQQELADKVNVTRSYIAQVESGTTRCRADFAQRLDGALGAEGRLVESWDDLLDSIKTTKYAKHFVKFPKIEASAEALRTYETHVVYGLFQTEDYAAALIKDAEGVAVRMRRQQHVMAEECPKIFVVLEETVLYKGVGSRQIMREQMERLLEVADRDEVHLQVIPLDVHVEEARAPFALAVGRDHRQAAYIVTGTGGETTTDEVQISELNKTFAILQSEALNVRDTRALIRRVIKERWT